MTPVTLTERTAAISGLRILVVEDEMLIAMSVMDALTALGCSTIMAPRVAKALRLVATESIDGAMLDLNVAGETVYPVAEVLRGRDIPFIFVTGEGAADVRSDYRDRPVLQKPYSVADLEQVARFAFAAAQHS